MSFEIGDELEAEMDGTIPVYTDMIMPVTVISYIDVADTYVCLLQQFDDRYYDSYATWPSHELHVPRTTEPNITYHVGQTVHLKQRSGDFIIWRKSIIIGKTRTRYRVKYRNGQYDTCTQMCNSRDLRSDWEF